MALCRPATDGFWCACYLVSCVLHLVSVPVSKNLCYLHLCGSLLFSAGHDGLHVTGAVPGHSPGYPREKTYRAAVVVPALSAITHNYRGRQYGET